MKNLLVGMILLGSAAVLSPAHAADAAAAGKSSRFMRLSSGDAAGGVYSIHPNKSTRFIALDNGDRRATENKPIALHGGSPRVAVKRMDDPSLPYRNLSIPVAEQAAPEKIEPTPLALQKREPVNARRVEEVVEETVVSETKTVEEKTVVTVVEKAPAERPAPQYAAIASVAKEPVLPLVQPQQKHPHQTLDAAFDAIEKNLESIRPEVVVADASVPRTKTEVVIRDAESLLKNSREVVMQAEAAPVQNVAIAEVAPMAREALLAKPISGVENRAPIVLADASLSSAEPWETVREITGTEREFMLDRSLKRASKHVQAIAEEESQAEAVEADSEESTTIVSLDDEYIPESSSAAAELMVAPVAKPNAPQSADGGESEAIAFQWPVRATEQKISSKFGSRVHPISGKRHFHTGIDIPAPRGTAVMASADGEVIEVGSHPRLGKFIKIDHGQGVYSIYGHLDRYMVRKGRKVEAGKRIGSVGSTGRSTGPHLHFTINRNGKLQNPMTVLRDSANSNSLALAKPE